MRHGEACITQPRRVANQSSNGDMLVDDGDVAANSPSKPNRADHRAAGRRQADFWHLDEMVVRIAGKRMYLWRAVDHEGEVLDMLVQRGRDKRAALRLMRKLLQEIRLRAEIPHDRQARLLRSCLSASSPDLSSSAGATGEQSRRELP